MKFKRQQAMELFICVLTCYNSIIYPDTIIIITIIITIIIIIVIVTTIIMIMTMIIKT